MGEIQCVACRRGCKVHGYEDEEHTAKLDTNIEDAETAEKRFKQIRL